MNTMAAFMMGELHRHEEQRVFDWELAARIIKMKNPKEASAGLKEDWGATADTIWSDGAPRPKEEVFCYLASTWAMPTLEVDDEKFPCYKMASDVPGWDAHTFWPPEALRILGILEDDVLEGEIVEDPRQLSATTITVPLLTAGDPDET